MAHSPPRTPRFLSAVPAQQHIETARFGQKPAQQIRPAIADPNTAKNERAPETQSGAPRAPAALSGQPSTPGTNPALPPHSPAQLPANGANASQAQAANAANGQAVHPSSTPDAIPLDLVRSRLAASIDALRLQSEKLAEQARADVMEVAFQIARRIVEVEVRQSPEPLFALIRTSLAQLATARRITLRVSAQDIESLRSPRGQEATGTVQLVEVELAADPALEPGECMIESDLGQIDGRLANRFAELRRHVAESAESVA